MTEGGPVIALCGKGGVGKTTVSSLILRHYGRADRGRNLLAVDADHAGGLSMALGVEPARTLDDLRVEAAERLRQGSASRRSLAPTFDYLLLEALGERDNLALLAAGRPADPGCFCALNSLLRQALGLLVGQFDLTVIDAEAGVEQVNREVTERVDLLLLVADTSVKALRVAEAVSEVAGRGGREPARALIVNRVRAPEELEQVRARTSLPVVGALPEDELVRRFDAEERSFLELPDGEATEALASILSLLPTLARW